MDIVLIELLLFIKTIEPFSVAAPVTLNIAVLSVRSLIELIDIAGLMFLVFMISLVSVLIIEY